MRTRTLVLALALTGLAAAPAALRAQMPRPASHTATWVRSHGPAAADEQMCRMCHTQTSFCTTCHDGASRPTFHSTNYVQRHGEDALTRETDCASCHQAQAFCVSCHQGVGAARTGAPRAAYHDAQSDWMLIHGRVARRSIETCSSCHRQVDCTKCHSPTGYARINPHPAGLDLERLRTANAAVCQRCHITGPPSAP